MARELRIRTPYFIASYTRDKLEISKQVSKLKTRKQVNKFCKYVRNSTVPLLQGYHWILLL